MPENKIIFLLNDSFPPQIDGVSNTILNYAREITANGSDAMVITPSHPEAEDEKYPFPVIRYPSVNFSRMDGYRAGIPFSPEAYRTVFTEKPALLHTHCPIISALVARELRYITAAPIVLTYHTKFDIDIANLIQGEQLQKACRKVLAANINACDEVWAVSRGAGENLRAMGYNGDYIVMPNGVDLPLGRAFDEQIAAAVCGYDLPYGVPIYLFVGRMMWYKGVRIVLDALAKLQYQGKDFRMVFIGDGDDRGEIEAYAKTCGISQNCIFTGAIRNRDTLRAWYSKADLFLFPSTYDTNGLVVREAAACGLGAVLIKDSCAAEGVTNGRNGFLIDENAESLSICLLSLYNHPEKTKAVGECASRELYISWETSVKAAMNRYQVVIENSKRTNDVRRSRPKQEIARLNRELISGLVKLSNKRRSK